MWKKKHFLLIWIKSCDAIYLKGNENYLNTTESDLGWLLELQQTLFVFKVSLMFAITDDMTWSCKRVHSNEHHEQTYQSASMTMTMIFCLYLQRPGTWHGCVHDNGSRARRTMGRDDMTDLLISISICNSVSMTMIFLICLQCWWLDMVCIIMHHEQGTRRRQWRGIIWQTSDIIGQLMNPYQWQGNDKDNDNGNDNDRLVHY